MCGRYGFSVKDAQEVYERFDIINTLEDFSPRWNVAPGQMNPVITAHSPKQISRMFWGLIPFFAQDENYKYKTINARAETLTQLASYRQSIKNKRCLIPATGFFEPDKKSKEKPPFTWHYFKLMKSDLFAFAGLYDVWKDKKTGKEIYSYTIITTEPNKVVGKYHDRMPVILHKEDEDRWIDPDITEPEQVLDLLIPYPDDEMEEWQVSDDARNPRNDKPYIIEPVKSKPKMEQKTIL